MKGLFFMILLLTLAGAAQAGGFYKWRDANGVMHITDLPPDDAVGVEIDSDTRINKAPMSNLDFGPMGAGQGRKPDRDKALDDTINNLESEIRYLESQKRMDPSMERDGLRSDIRRKQEQLHELRLEQSGLSKAEIAARKEQRRARAAASSPHGTSSVVAPSQPRTGMTDQNGVFYAPAAGNNYINTRSGSLVIPQGGNTYLDTGTGKTMHAH